MKSLREHLNESLLVEDDLNMKPRTKEELEELVKQLIN